MIQFFHRCSTNKEYYFTLKDGRFRAYPDGVGGPFKFLDDATDAMARHRAWKQEQKEKERQIDIFMYVYSIKTKVFSTFMLPFLPSYDHALKT
jgi:hypothetical protein